jgi:ribosomal protein S1
MTSRDDGRAAGDTGEALVGSLVEGTVEAVFRWGIIVDLGFPSRGFIDPLYIDDDDPYEVGQRVRAYVVSVDADAQRKLRLRPPGQTPVADRLRQQGHDV